VNLVICINLGLLYIFVVVTPDLDFVFLALVHKAIDKQKLSQLGYMTGRKSYWLANVARLLDAILTPGQCIERDLSYGRSCDRKNDLLPVLQNVTITDTHHTRHRHRHRHQYRPHL